MSDNLARNIPDPIPHSSAPQVPSRKVGILLGIGIFFMPYIFGWYTLRNGFSMKSRVISFLWMAILLISFGKDRPKNDVASTDKPVVTNSQVTPTQSKTLDESLFKGLLKNTDKVDGVTWYHVPGYGNDIGRNSSISIYLGRKNDLVWARLFSNYTSDEWLFIKNHVFLIDGQRYEISPKMETNVGSGNVREWFDTPLEEDTLLIIRSIANSKETILRYEGSQFRKDRTIRKGEKEAIKKILKVLDASR